MRNRISAQLSRDRKKHYIQELEAQNQDLVNQNHQLLAELHLMKENHIQLQSEKSQIQKQTQVANPNCPCSLLKSDGNFDENMTDDDFPIKDMDNMSLTRIWQKKTSMGCLGYSFVLLTMLAFVFFFHNHEEMNKFKPLDGVQFMSQYQMDIEKTPPPASKEKKMINNNKMEREEVSRSMRASHDQEVAEKVEEAATKSPVVSNNTMSTESQAPKEARDYLVKHEVIDIEYQAPQDN